jgi:hypothetical protein
VTTTEGEKGMGYLDATEPQFRALWIHVNGVPPCEPCWMMTACDEGQRLRKDLDDAVTRWLDAEWRDFY